MTKSLTGIFDFLVQEQALIVHFSGCPKGGGLEKYFPNDLLGVLNNEEYELSSGIKTDPQKGLSCSVVKLTDDFTSDNRNAMGHVGLILKPNKADSIVSAHHTDSGSYCDLDSGYRTTSFGRNWTDSTLKETLSKREMHNEWVVKEFEIIGVLVVDNAQVIQADFYEGITEPISMPVDYDISKANADFPGLRIFKLSGGRLYEGSNEVAISSIYR